MANHHLSSLHGTGVSEGFNTVERIAQDLHGRSTDFRRLSTQFSNLSFVQEMLELSKVGRQRGI